MIPRFIMIGGFLGAGKTTTIARLAKQFQTEGKRVGIVTNDQATDLVDTNLLRSQGFDVGEVAGSCFCCNFNALTDTFEQLSVDERPDVIIAEPVGSCTDLVATVIRPLQQIYSVPFEIAPYGVIVKPSHGIKILRRDGTGGFSPQAEYIFRKQLEEADFVILNRIDQLSAETVNELTGLIDSNFPSIPCMRISALTGAGFDAFRDYLDKPGSYGSRTMDVDYDVYAEGEAELGWLNAQVSLRSDSPFELDPFLLKLLEDIRDALQAQGAEIAHLKVIGMHEGIYSVCNIVCSDSDPTLSIGSGCKTASADVVVNARVAIDPHALAQIVQDCMVHLSQSHSIQCTVNTIQCFRPGRPVPTHRL